MACFNDGACYTCYCATLKDTKINCGDLSHLDKNDNIEFNENDIQIFNNKWVSWVRLFNTKTKSKYNFERGDFTSVMTLESGGRRIIKQILKDINCKDDPKKLCSRIAQAEIIDESLLPSTLITDFVNIEAVKKEVLAVINLELKALKDEYKRTLNSVDKVEDEVLNRIERHFNKNIYSELEKVTNKYLEGFFNTEKGVELIKEKMVRVQSKTIIEKLPENIIEIVKDEIKKYVSDRLDKIDEWTESYKKSIDEKFDNFSKVISEQLNSEVIKEVSRYAKTKNEEVIKLGATVEKLIGRVKQLQNQVNEVKHADYVTSDALNKIIGLYEQQSNKKKDLLDNLITALQEVRRKV